MNKLLFNFFSIMFLVGTIIGAEETIASKKDFSNLKLEQLMDIEIPSMMDSTVTSVSKRAQKLSKTAAASYVITADAIRRSGVTSLADAFRLAPGVTVSEPGIYFAHRVVSIRGHHNFYSSNKVLVLVDGRSVYGSSLATTWWDAMDLMLEDIERIEIIRGPGGTVWGANAMNGIINIITKNAKDTQGGLVSVGVGTVERSQENARYGFKLGNSLFMRVYGKHFMNSGYDEGSDIAKDALKYSDQLRVEEFTGKRAGFRIDATPGDKNTFMVSGDIYENETNTKFYRSNYTTSPYRELVPYTPGVNGGFLLGKWTHSLADDNEFYFQAFINNEDRDFHDTTFNTQRVDFEFQHNFKLFSKHDITWGLGYRADWFDAERIPELYFTKEHTTSDIFSAMLQDNIELLEDKLFLTLGAKFQRNTYTGNELMPAAKLLYTPNQKHTFWTSASKAVHTPSVIMDNAIYSVIVDKGAFAASNSFYPKDDLKAETVNAYEAGWRFEPKQNLWFDLATYYNKYDKLTSYEHQTAGWQSFPANHYEVYRQYDNMLGGISYGLELAANWRVNERLTIGGAYTNQHTNMRHLNNGGNDGPNEKDLYERGSPEELVSINFEFNLPYNLEFDVWVRHTAQIQHRDQKPITDFDLRLGWKPNKNLEFSVAGKNLGDKAERQMSSIEVHRSLFAKMTYTF